MFYRRILITILIILLSIKSYGGTQSPIKDSLNLEKINNVLDHCHKQYLYFLNKVPDNSIPRTFENGQLKTTPPNGWVSGFYPGSLIYLFENSHDNILWKEAKEKLKLIKNEQFNTHTHDLGFMMYCSYGNAIKVKENKDFDSVLMNSAKSLASRYNDTVKSIRSWDSDSAFKVIIDNMMNLELLFWATHHSGDSTYYNIAVNHANTTLKNHFRKDNSSYHVVEYDPDTGKILSKHTNQGLVDSSAWARGQAWGLYGFTLMYRETREEKYLDRAKAIADFIMNNPNLPEDNIPYWDFDVQQQKNKIRDASAASIISSALIELSKYAGISASKVYMSFVRKTINSLTQPEYLAKIGENGGFILKHSVGNIPADSEIDVPLAYADYYFIEALLRYKKFLEKRMASREEILKRAKKYLVKTSEPVETSSALKNFNDEAGKWDDINYSGNEMAGWEPFKHIERVKKLCLTWSNPESESFKNTELKKAINRALNYWFENHYKSSNWWFNEIGVPQNMRDIVILMRDHMDKDALEKALKVVAQYKIYGTGANLIWSADIAFHYGLLTENYSVMDHAMSLIQKEVRIAENEEGIQPDYSFQQHGPRLQMYHYGKAFLQNNVKMAWETRNTDWEYPEYKLRILKEFLLKGWQWMARGIYTIPETLDRAATRENALEAAEIQYITTFFSEILPEDKAKFEGFERNQNIDSFSLEGFRYFPYSDISVYHQPEYSFFLKTVSDRTSFSESINGENLKGSFLNNGDTYFIKSGKEYYNILPVWDWKLIPGITNFKNSEKPEKLAFTGSVTNDKAGLSEMKFRITGKDSTRFISMNKFWAANKNVVINLMSDIQYENVSASQTALNQSRLIGDVYVNNPKTPVKEGTRSIKNVKWIYHDGFVYIPLNPKNKFELHNDFSSGSWYAINHSGSKKEVRIKTFLPVLILNSSAESSGYVVAACSSAKEAHDLYLHPTWKIINNDKNYQAVEFTDGTVMSSHYSAGYLLKNDEIVYAVNQPCLIVKSGTEFSISDPSHHGKNLSLTYENQTKTVELPCDGSSVTINFKKA